MNIYRPRIKKRSMEFAGSLKKNQELILIWKLSQFSITLRLKAYLIYSTWHSNQGNKTVARITFWNVLQPPSL